MVIAEYNHGVVRVGGDLAATLFLVMDHDAHVAGTCKAVVVNTDEDDPSKLLSEEAFVDDELVSERVHALARLGRSPWR